MGKLSNILNSGKEKVRCFANASACLPSSLKSTSLRGKCHEMVGQLGGTRKYRPFFPDPVFLSNPLIYFSR